MRFRKIISSFACAMLAAMTIVPNAGMQAFADVEITTQPVDVTVAYPSGAEFTVEAAAPSLVTGYQWEYSDREGEWKALSSASASTDALSIPATRIYQGKGAYTPRVRCVLTGADGTETVSDEAMLYISNPDEYKGVFYIGDRPILPGETLDVAELGIGSGTISLSDDASEITFQGLDINASQIPFSDFSDPSGAPYSSNMEFVYYSCPYESVKLTADAESVIHCSGIYDGNNPDEAGASTYSFCVNIPAAQSVKDNAMFVYFVMDANTKTLVDADGEEEHQPLMDYTTFVGDIVGSTEESGETDPAPSEEPVVAPTEAPDPAAEPTAEPTATPTEEPVVTPTADPTAAPTEVPTVTPTPETTPVPATPTPTPVQQQAPQNGTAQAQTSNGTYVQTVVPNVQPVVTQLPDREYTLTLDPNGGTLRGSAEPFSPTWYMLATGEQTWNGIAFLTPEKEGYRFTGYYDSAGIMVYGPDGMAVNSKYFFNGRFQGTEDLMVHAEWEEYDGPDLSLNGEYTLTVDPRGGLLFNKKDTFTPDAKLVVGTENLSDIPNLVPNANGYKFIGYYDADNVLVYNENGKAVDGKYFQDGIFQGSENLEVMAKWVRDVVQYTLTFDSNGGTEVPPEKYDTGTIVTKFSTPLRNGYFFAGWYTMKEGGTKVTKVSMLEDKTIYAHWTADPAYGPSVTATPEPTGGGSSMPAMLPVIMCLAGVVVAGCVVIFMVANKKRSD